MNVIVSVDKVTSRVSRLTLESVKFSDERVLGILMRGFEQGATFTVETKDGKATFQYEEATVL